MSAFKHKEADLMLWPVFYLKEDSLLEINYESTAYNHWLFSNRFALINLLEDTSNKWRFDAEYGKTVSLIILKKIEQWSIEHKLKLLVTGIMNDDDTKLMLAKLESIGISTLDISVDLYNLLPYDRHPSSLANTHYANELYKYLSEH